MIRVHRVKRKNLMVVKPTILKDERVSLFARGLFCTAFVMAQKGYDINELFELVPDDEDEVYKGLMELRRYGYCKRVKVDGITEFRLFEDPLVTSRKALRVKNKSPLIYSKSMAQVGREGKQSPVETTTQDDPEFADWDEITVVPEVPQETPSLFALKRVKKVSPQRGDKVPPVAHRIMYRLCYLVESESDMLLLNAGHRGLVASALGKLRDAGADLTQLNRFEDWWTSDWRSKNKITGAYQPPRPEQVVEHWTVAMKANTYTHKKAVPTPTEPHQVEVDLLEVMRHRATTRNGKE